MGYTIVYGRFIDPSFAVYVILRCGLSYSKTVDPATNSAYTQECASYERVAGVCVCECR